jgi:hypothetical protein
MVRDALAELELKVQALIAGHRWTEAKREISRFRRWTATVKDRELNSRASLLLFDLHLARGKLRKAEGTFQKGIAAARRRKAFGTETDFLLAGAGANWEHGELGDSVDLYLYAILSTLSRGHYDTLAEVMGGIAHRLGEMLSEGRTDEAVSFADAYEERLAKLDMSEDVRSSIGWPARFLKLYVVSDKSLSYHEFVYVRLQEMLPPPDDAA